MFLITTTCATLQLDLCGRLCAALVTQRRARAASTVFRQGADGGFQPTVDAFKEWTPSVPTVRPLMPPPWTGGDEGERPTVRGYDVAFAIVFRWKERADSKASNFDKNPLSFGQQ